MHVNLGMSLRKTKYALKELYNINISHQQVANYCKTAAVCIKPFIDHYDYNAGKVYTADETYIKIEASKPSSGSLWTLQAAPLLDTGFPRNVMSERVSLPCVWHSGISKSFRKTSALLQMGTVHMFWLHNSSCVNTALFLNLTLLKSLDLPTTMKYQKNLDLINR